MVYGLCGPRRWILRSTWLCGTLMVSALVAITEPVGATPFFYLWPMLTAPTSRAGAR